MKLGKKGLLFGMSVKILIIILTGIVMIAGVIIAIRGNIFSLLGSL